jgi:hypothetical protein
MTDIKKSTDPGLSNAERKELRGLEAKDAIADHEDDLPPKKWTGLNCF